MKKVKKEEWIPSDNITLEDNAEIAIRCEKSILVVAGPGAGKTELLAQKAGYLFQTNSCCEPQKILAISFKTDAAENLKERVLKRCGNEIKKRFSSMTYDAFAKRILDHFRLALPLELQPQAGYSINDNEIIDLAFKKAGYNNPQNLKKSLLTKFYEDTLSNVEFPLKKDGLGEKVWKLLVKGFDGNKATLSFKMINMLAEYLIRSNPKIKRALQYTYSYVFLDEFQDTTDLQYSLVKTCFKESKSIITAVGDSKQRIMLWAGALKSVFLDFKADFISEETQLLMNHRSAPRLVSLQKQMYASLQEKESMTQPSDKWSPNDGEIKLVISDSEFDEARIISEDIKHKIEEGIEINDICILCKQLPQNYSEFIISELANMGIRARIENDYQDLIKEPIIDLLIRFMLLSIDRKRPKDWEYIKSLAEEFYGVDYAQQDAVYYKCQEELSVKLNEVSSLLKDFEKIDDVQIILTEIMDFWGVAKIKSHYPIYQQGDYLEKRIESFKNFLLDELKLFSNNWILALESFCGKYSIPIMTIHKSKGLEYSAVYFVGLEDGAFWNFKKQPEEDRCAFFVALSRAKQYITFTYCSYRSKLRYPCQCHDSINEFFELLQKPGVADVQICDGKTN